MVTTQAIRLVLRPQGAEVFRRRRHSDETDQVDDQDFEEYDEDLDEAPDPAPDPDEIVDVVNPLAEQPRVVVEATTGPWDARDVAKDSELPRVDLGGLRVPVIEEVELRLQVEDNVVVAVALLDGANQLLVHAFAAPKSSGIWDDVRDEIASSLRANGGSAEHVEGRFGTELRARVPGESGTDTQPARFIGVDGPRWFLRGLLTGPAATDPAAGGRLEAVFREIVVDRGPDAMAPRDALPLHLPREVADSAVPELEDEPEAPRLQLQERGPEITEIQ